VKRYRDIAGDGGSDVAGQVARQQERLHDRLRGVRAIAGVASGKGGVGKSTVTAGLAGSLAAAGWRCGVLDADLNGPSMAKMLGVRGRRLTMGAAGVEPPLSPAGVKVMSMDLLLPSDAAPLAWRAPTQEEAHTWRGSMEAQALREFLADTDWGDLDLLLVDLPPGTDRLGMLAPLAPSLAGAVVVTIPSEVSQLVVRRSITAARQAGVRVLGVVENMAGLFPGPDVATLAAEAGTELLGSVPFDRALALAMDRGVPVAATDPDTPASVALAALADRVARLVLPGARC
jgi:ATP-binding protein involved in chromosome partitioning